jgi:hypothetical protein
VERRCLGGPGPRVRADAGDPPVHHVRVHRAAAPAVVRARRRHHRLTWAAGGTGRLVDGARRHLSRRPRRRGPPGRSAARRSPR